MEFCEGGSVGDLLRICKKQFNEDIISAICACIVRGLAYLHEKKICHRDIKAANILLSGTLAKLGIVHHSLHCNHLILTVQSLFYQLILVLVQH